MNKIFIVGNLTRDPERVVFDSGKINATFTVAVNRLHDREKADYFTVIVWNALAENCCKYLAQGKKCAVVGSYESRKYEKDGVERTVWEVNADNVEFLSPVER